MNSHAPRPSLDFFLRTNCNEPPRASIKATVVPTVPYCNSSATQMPRARKCII
jgi:hypothetical protein